MLPEPAGAMGPAGRLRKRTRHTRPPQVKRRVACPRTHPAYVAIMQNCAINNTVMAHGAHKEHTMTPYATAATHPDPMGPTNAAGAHGGAQGARHNARQAGGRTEAVHQFRC